MDLERVGMEENPWRHGDQPPPMAWPNMGGAQQQQGQGWAHHSPQAAPGRRNPWDPNSLADNLNEALGIGPPGGAPAWAGVGGPPGTQGDFNSVKNLWSDPQHMAEHAAHYGHMQPHPQGAMMNGMMDPNAMQPEWGMRGGEQQMWSDPLKMQDDGTGYWKQQQAGGAPGQWAGQQGGGPPRWPPQMGGPPQHAPPHHRGAPMAVRGPGGGWPGGPNGMMTGGPKPPMWGEGGPRMGGGGGMGGGRGGGGGGQHRGGPGGYAPRGMDMSVPPPMDMNMMRGGPPHGGHMWKAAEGMGGPNGMRGAPQYPMQQPMGAFMGQKPAQFEEEPMGKFAMGGGGGNGGGQAQDDLMWHDPNGELKKWQRDTGVSVWGDPDKAALRNINYWIVGENEEEDLEAALSRCPVPAKRTEGPPTTVVPSGDEITTGPSTSGSVTPGGTGGGPGSISYNSRLPPIPIGKRSIVVTGWGDLPDNDPNNPNKIDPSGGDKWGDPSQSDTPWYLSNANTPFNEQGGAAWGGAAGAPGAMNGQEMRMKMEKREGITVSRMLGGNNQQNTEAIADQLRIAVEKGYLDMAVLTQQHLPPAVLAQMNSMLAKIPALDSAEARMEEFMESSRPPGEIDDGQHPPQWMNEVQKVEYNRLIIELTTARIEVSDLSKKMQAALNELREQGALPEQTPPPAQSAGGESAHDNYQYSFLG